MSDCRLVLDNLNDYASLEGSLVTGSDVVDIAQAQMTPGDSGWKIEIKPVAPAQQNPRLQVSVAVYVDADGRMENNATVGPRMGADTVYGIVSGKDGWKITREQMDVNQNGFVTVATKATFNVGAEGYSIVIPYDELPKTAPAYWKAGAGEKDATRLTVDYVPDAGMACTPSLAHPNPLVLWASRAKNFLYSDALNQLIAVAFVIAAVGVVIWRRKGHKKKDDLQA